MNVQDSTSSNSQNKLSGRGRPKGSNAMQSIVDNAGVAFVKHGYHACTVEHILEETGVSRTNFYRFFKNKDAVFISIMQDHLNRLSANQKQTRKSIRDEDSAETKIQIMFDSYLRACFSAGELMSVMFQEQNTLPELREMREGVINQFKKNINSFLESGGFEKPNELLLEGCLAAIDRMMLLESLNKDELEIKIERLKKNSCQITNLLFDK